MPACRETPTAGSPGAREKFQCEPVMPGMSLLCPLHHNAQGRSLPVQCIHIFRTKAVTWRRETGSWIRTCSFWSWLTGSPCTSFLLSGAQLGPVVKWEWCYPLWLSANRRMAKAYGNLSQSRYVFLKITCNYKEAVFWSICMYIYVYLFMCLCALILSLSFMNTHFR